MKWVALKNELDFLKELRKTSNIKIMILIEKKNDVTVFEVF